MRVWGWTCYIPPYTARPVIKPLRATISCVAASLLLTSCSVQEERGPVVLAASSLTQVMEHVADAWEQQGHKRPQLSFAGTPSIARQVEEGAPADVFVSADSEWMDWLAQRQLIRPDTRRDIARNGLAFVWRDIHLELPTGSRSREAPFAPREIAMADPDTVPAGRYARQALEYAGVWDRVDDKIVPTENVRIALALVERGEADLGVVYSSDAAASPDLLSAPLELPPGVGILYPAAQLRSSRNAEAIAFLDFLAGSEGLEILCKHGFTLPPERGAC